MRNVLVRMGRAARNVPRRLSATAEFLADSAPMEVGGVRRELREEPREVDLERRPRQIDEDR